MSERIANHPNCGELDANFGMDLIRGLELSNAVGKQLGPNLDTVFAVMRMCMVLGKARLSKREFSLRYKLMHYSKYGYFADRDTRLYHKIRGSWQSMEQETHTRFEDSQSESGFLEMVLSCKIRGSEDDCDKKLSHVLTDRGVCTALNAKAVDKNHYKSGQFSELFKSVFSTPQSHSQLFFITGTGSRSRITLVLDVHR